MHGPALGAHVEEEITQALAALDSVTRRLRRECPWDREQDERTIVPHTVEEAYELADAAQPPGDRVERRQRRGDLVIGRAGAHYRLSRCWT